MNRTVGGRLASSLASHATVRESKPLALWPASASKATELLENPVDRLDEHEP